MAASPEAATAAPKLLCPSDSCVIRRWNTSGHDGGQGAISSEAKFFKFLNIGKRLTFL